MRVTNYLSLLAASLTLAACNNAESTHEPADTMMADELSGVDGSKMSGDMPMIAGDEAGQTASAEGVVTAVNDSAGSITIDHGPVPEVDWPAMEMAFSADGENIGDIAVGDRVTFEFQVMESGSRIVSIAKQ